MEIDVSSESPKEECMSVEEMDEFIKNEILNSEIQSNQVCFILM